MACMCHGVVMSCPAAAASHLVTGRMLSPTQAASFVLPLKFIHGGCSSSGCRSTIKGIRVTFHLQTLGFES